MIDVFVPVAGTIAALLGVCVVVRSRSSCFDHTDAGLMIVVFGLGAVFWKRFAKSHQVISNFGSGLLLFLAVCLLLKELIFQFYAIGCGLT